MYTKEGMQLYPKSTVALLKRCPCTIINVHKTTQNKGRMILSRWVFIVELGCE